VRGDAECACRHCRRIEVPQTGQAGSVAFHPDVHFLWQDLRTVTSADATRQVLRAAQFHPFEARGQVFVIVNAETLSDEAANVLLKMLEEPPRSAPRNFLLSTPAADRLLPTVRSRSLAVYLGAIERPDPERVRTMAVGFRRAIESFAAGRSAIHLLAAADALYRAAQWDDPRDARPFAMAAAVVMEAYRVEPERGVKAPAAALLALAEDLLLAPETRTRNIAAQRILEGLVSKHLTAS
jgi:DNA polymerase-3 subunit delta'